jgi:hypothetical protein
LIENFIAHDGLGSQQTQQAELGEAAEAEPLVAIERRQPIARLVVVDMTGMRQRHPHVG